MMSFGILRFKIQHFMCNLSDIQVQYIHGLIKQKCQNDFENVMTRVICSIYNLHIHSSVAIFFPSVLIDFCLHCLHSMIMRRRRQINLLCTIYQLFIFL